MSDAVIIRNGNFKRVPGEVSNPNQLDASAPLVLLVKHVGDTLERHYPGWWWAVKPDEFGGIIDIQSFRISTHFAYTLHIPKLRQDPRLRRVIEAGGEFLERFGIRRGPYNHDQWMRIKVAMGAFVPDISDKSARERRNVRTEQIKAALASGHARIAINPSIGAALAARKQGLI